MTKKEIFSRFYFVLPKKPTEETSLGFVSPIYEDGGSWDWPTIDH
jgi:hypothetical protein